MVLELGEEYQLGLEGAVEEFLVLSVFAFSSQIFVLLVQPKVISFDKVGPVVLGDHLVADLGDLGVEGALRVFLLFRKGLLHVISGFSLQLVLFSTV